MKVKCGFTLIELLVVIAIIAILAAILFPVFAKVREKARQTTCASNERELSLAMLQYVQDNEEKFPAAFDQGRTPNINWGQEIFPYVKSLGAFACPSNVLASATNTLGYDGGQAPFVPSSYAMNGAMGFVNCSFSDLFNCTQYGPYKPLAAIDAPSQKVMIMESFVNNPNAFWPDWFECSNAACTAANATTSNYYNAGFAGHTDFMNVVYLDGHVKAVRPETLAGPINQLGPVKPMSTTSADPNCTNLPQGTNGYTSINCDEVSPTMQNVMAAIATKYGK